MFNYLKSVVRRNYYQLLLHRKSHAEVSSIINENLKVNKIKKDPFMKNVFIGNVDRDILKFPEINVELAAENVEKAQLQVHCDAIDSDETQLLALLRSGICRMCLPNQLGKPIQHTHFLLEIEKYDISLSTALLFETQYSLIIGTLLKYGSKAQRKYIEQLIEGEIIGGYAMHEEEAGSDPPSLKCFVEQTDFNEETTYILNGEKTWVTNGNKADFFIVFAKFRHRNKPSNVAEDLSVFIVERNKAGVTVNKEKVGRSNCDIYNIKFDNVKLSTHNLIGSIGDGYEIATSNFESCKFVFSLAFLNVIRKLLAQVTVQVSETNRFPNPLRDYELVQYKLSKVTAIMYALESSIYLLAGMKDQYEMDTSLEAVIIQNMLNSYGVKAINECISIGGTKILDSSYFKSDPVFTNLDLLSRAFSAPDIFNLYISLKGLEFVGKSLSDIVRKARNPLNYPFFIYKRIFYSRRQATDSPKLDKNLYLEFHPSLKGGADQLEYCIYRLQYCLELKLIHHATESVQRHLDLIRLSEIATDIFSMIAVLSRSSRAYCTGIRYADQEIIVANAWCLSAMNRIKRNVSYITAENHLDQAFLKLAPHIFQLKGYFYTNPTEKNIV